MIKTTGKEVCPYFGAEQREEWHRARGLDDPQKADKPSLPIATAGEWGEDQVKKKDIERIPFGLGNVNRLSEASVEVKSDDKHAAYRERNKAKLALKARERRAKK